MYPTVHILKCKMWQSWRDLWARLQLDPKTGSASRLWNAIHCRVPGSRVLISASRTRSCQYNNHRERKPFHPSAPHINTTNLHTQASLVRQQLKPGPSGGGVGARQPQIYKLDFYPFTSSHWHTGSGAIDCVDCMLAVIIIVCARDALLMTAENWAVMYVILSNNELSNN